MLQDMGSWVLIILLLMSTCLLLRYCLRNALLCPHFIKMRFVPPDPVQMCILGLEVSPDYFS